MGRLCLQFVFDNGRVSDFVHKSFAQRRDICPDVCDAQQTLFSLGEQYLTNMVPVRLLHTRQRPNLLLVLHLLSRFLPLLEFLLRDRLLGTLLYLRTFLQSVTLVSTPLADYGSCVLDFGRRACTCTSAVLALLLLGSTDFIPFLLPNWPLRCLVPCCITSVFNVFVLATPLVPGTWPSRCRLAR
jgi:hypothetical protein